MVTFAIALLFLLMASNADKTTANKTSVDKTIKDEAIEDKTIKDKTIKDEATADKTFAEIRAITAEITTAAITGDITPVQITGEITTAEITAEITTTDEVAGNETSADIISVSLSATSCHSYQKVPKNWSQFAGKCYIQLATATPNDEAPFSCASWDISLLTDTFTRIIPQNVAYSTTGYNWVQSTLFASQAAAIYLNLLSLENEVNVILVENPGVGYCRIRCRSILSLSCTIPYDVTICTYNRLASESVIEALLASCGQARANVARLIRIDQTMCP